MVDYDHINIIPSLGKSGAAESVKDNILMLGNLDFPPADLIPKLIRSGKNRITYKYR